MPTKTTYAQLKSTIGSFENEGWAYILCLPQRRPEEESTSLRGRFARTSGRLHHYINLNVPVKRWKGQCYDCNETVRCDEGGLASYHINFGAREDCPGSREAVKPWTLHPEKEESCEELPPVREPDSPFRVEVPVTRRLRQIKPALVRMEPPAPVPGHCEDVAVEPVRSPPPPIEDFLDIETLVAPDPEPLPESVPMRYAEIDEQETPTPPLLSQPNRAFQDTRKLSAEEAKEILHHRKELVLDTAKKHYDLTGEWPIRTELALSLGVRTDMITKVMEQLIKEKRAKYDRDGSVMPTPEKVVAKFLTEEPPAKRVTVRRPPPSETKAPPVLTNLPKGYANGAAPVLKGFEGDTVYLKLIEERDALAKKIDKILEELGPQEERLERLERALKAYTGEA